MLDSTLHAHVARVFSRSYELADDKFEKTTKRFLELCAESIDEHGVPWSSIRKTIELVISDVLEDDPNHPVIARLRDFIEERNRRESKMIQ